MIFKPNAKIEIEISNTFQECLAKKRFDLH
jgi:hypothetical protein